MKIKSAAVCCSLTIVLAGSIASAQWSQFRGPRGSAVSEAENLPAKWSAEQGVLWKTPLPGRANSCPAVTSDRIDLTTQLKDQSLWVLSLRRSDGKLLRKTKVGEGKLAAKGPANLYAHRHNPATPTPVADDEHVCAFFGTGLLVCVHAESGRIRWQKDMVKEYGAYDITFGMGSSPRLWNDLLIINCMTKGASYVAALNKATGDQVWRVERRLPAKDDGPDAYSSPTIQELNGRDVLLISGSDHVTGHDPRSGKRLWVSGGLTIDSKFGRVIASATGEGRVVVATAGNPGGAGLGRVIAFDGAGQGEISSRLWTQEKQTPDSSTPVCYQGRVYMITDDGVGSCVDLNNGEVKWQKRLGKGPFHASVVAGDGKVYFQSAAGNFAVVKAGDDGQVLATNQMPEDTFFATPAIGEGVLYLRSYGHLYAVGSP